MKSNKVSRKATRDLTAEKALVKTVADAGAAELVANAGEKLLDSITDNAILDQLPVVKILVGLGKTGIGISQYLLTKKIIKFMNAVNVSNKTREKFLKRIKRDKKFEEKIGDTLFLLLERLDDMGKPALVGKIFAQFLEGKLSLDQMLRLLRAIERVYLPDLTVVKMAVDANDLSFDEHGEPSDEILAALSSSGLTIGGGNSPASITRLGELLIKVLYPAGDS